MQKQTMLKVALYHWDPKILEQFKKRTTNDTDDRRTNKLSKLTRSSIEQVHAKWTDAVTIANFWVTIKRRDLSRPQFLHQWMRRGFLRQPKEIRVRVKDYGDKGKEWHL